MARCLFSNNLIVQILLIIVLISEISSLEKIYLENTKLCRLKDNEEPTVVQLEKDEAKAIVHSKYFERWSGKYIFSCTFLVRAPSKYGIYVVVQNMNLRLNSTLGCKDYVRIDVRKKFYQFLNSGVSKEFCGKLSTQESLLSDASPDYDKALKHSVIADNGFETQQDVISITIFIANEVHKSDEKLDINIVLTAFKHDCEKRRANSIQCNKCEWISDKFAMDKIQNCPYTSCLDEDFCRNIDAKNEVRTIVSSGTGTKVSIGAVATIILVLLMFACCVWISRRMKLWCFDPTGRRQARMEMNATDRPTGFEETNVPYGDVVPDTMAPSAPPLGDDKDLPPSYSSLFPGK